MPIHIYNKDKNLVDLCEDSWDLPGQLSELENWLMEHGTYLEKGSYVADIGFDIRKDATGGGGVINTRMLEILNRIGMEVYLSEYPNVLK